MGTLLLKKPVAQAAPKGEIEELIDLVGSQNTDAEKLKKKIKELQADLKKYGDSEKKLQALVDNLSNGDDEEFTISGENFRAEIGPKGKSREITEMQGVRKMLGDKVFMEICKVNLKDIDNYLTLPQREKVITTTRTSRSISISRA